MNTLLDLPELTFNEDKHQYRVNGKFIWSVSHYLKPITSQIYGAIDEAVLKAAADRGTAIHFAVELYNEYRVTEIDEAHKLYLQAYIDWFTKYSPKILAVECRVYHPLYWYAGTCDIICEMGGKVYVVDLKATAELKSFLVALQLSGYAKAFIHHGVPVEKTAALHLKKDGTYTFEEYEIEGSFARFLGCLDLQNHIDNNTKSGGN